jgi:hypothetical protein
LPVKLPGQEQSLLVCGLGVLHGIVCNSCIFQLSLLSISRFICIFKILKCNLKSFGQVAIISPALIPPLPLVHRPPCAPTIYWSDHIFLKNYRRGNPPPCLRPTPVRTAKFSFLLYCSLNGVFGLDCNFWRELGWSDRDFGGRSTRGGVRLKTKGWMSALCGEPRASVIPLPLR